MNEVTAAIPAHLTEIPQKQERAKNTMGKDDFMKLLMVQLQNQDPLKPMDHHEFAAQLAQFGSLEQLQNIQKSIEGLSTGYGDGAKFNALNLIGKRVEASTSEVEMVSGQNVSLQYLQKDDIQPVKATIYGDGGKIVKEIPIDPRSRSTGIEWDGKDEDGKQLPSGKYTFRVQGNDKQGQATELSSELSGRVTAVDLNGKAPSLTVKTASGDVKLELSKVKNILNDEKADLSKPSLQGGSAGTGLSNAAGTSSMGAPALKTIPMEEPTEAAEAHAVPEEDPADFSTLDDRIWRGIPDEAGSMGSIKP